MSATTARGGIFARRVTAVFSTKVVAFSLSLTTALVISRILGPEGKGSYVAVTALPGLLGAIGVFGLPNAVNYFSARGTSIRGLLGAGILLTAILSAILIPLVWVSLPWLEKSVLGAAPDEQLREVLIVVPAALMSTFGMAVLFGRQQVRTYSTILIGQGLLTLTLSTLLVAVFRFGVPGAVASTIIVTWLLALADIIAVGRLSRREPGGKSVSLRGLAGYGVRLYPASITGYFNYRIDTFIIQAVMLAPKAPLGLYSMAVTMAELIFYVPDSVSIIFLPRIAGLSHEEADALLGRVSRLTMLLTCLVAAALIPVAWIGIHLVLPRFVDCLPALYVLVPAIISLSLSKVMTSYIAGRGRPGLISLGSTITMVVNIAANFILIPRFGIVGAATASLISYTISAAMLLSVASRLSQRSLLTLVVPGREEVLIVVAGVRRGLARARELASSRGRKPGTQAGAP
jgi:O-antigen/teichoic acid export membrane protein